MRRFFRLMLLLAVGAGLFSGPSWGQELRINPVPPHVKPQWLPVPGAPQIYYAPNLPTDLFRYRGNYYFYWQGYYYKSKTTKGPWKWVQETPALFEQIDQAYFKTVKREGKGTPAPPPEVAPQAEAPAQEATPAPSAPAATAPPAALTPPVEAPASD